MQLARLDGRLAMAAVVVGALVVAVGLGLWPATGNVGVAAPWQETATTTATVTATSVLPPPIATATMIPPYPTATQPVVPTVPPSNVCPQILRRVPAAAVSAALSNPGAVAGYNKPMNPARPEGPTNPLRTWLTIHAYAKPYHPLFNSLEYKAGCP